MGKSVKLVKRTVTALERLEGWAALSTGERKRRAAAAVRDGDRAALRELYEAYLHLHARGGLHTSPRTLTTYGRGMARLLTWCKGAGVMAHHVDSDGARRFVAWLSAEGLSGKSVQTYLTAARRFMSALRWAGLGKGDPFKGVSVRDETPAVEKARPYTLGELRALLAAATPRERLFVLLCADGGLRLAEACALRWTDLDLVGQTARVKGKGGKLRTVALTRRLTAALASASSSAPAPAADVLGASRRRWQQILDALCRRAGVSPRGPHALRHTCGTRLYSASKDLLLVARHLGHSSVTTAAIYSHLGSADYAEAVAALDTDAS